MDGVPTRLVALTERMPTAPLAAAGLIAGFGIAVGSGSRPLGGAVMGVCGLGCIGVWSHRDGPATTAALTATGLFAFAASHGLGLVIGAWPSVLLVSAATAGACWRLSDSRRPGRTASVFDAGAAPRASTTSRSGAVARAGAPAPASGDAGAATDPALNGSRAAAR